MIKKILVSLEKPTNEKSPFDDIAIRNGIKIEYKPFIRTENISVEEFRKYRLNLIEYTAIIFTNRKSIDYYFKLCVELRIPIQNDIRYFCISKNVANYLQKYIIYRKRKVFYDELKNGMKNLLPIIKNYPNERFLLPISNTYSNTLLNLLKKNKIKFKQFVLYRTINCDLSDIKKKNFDLIVFYSPNSVKSLLENFPKFKQKNTILASFGISTSKAIKNAGLKLGIEAPTTNTPSMSMALDLYLQENQ